MSFFEQVNAWLFDSTGFGFTKGQKTMANSLPVTMASDQPLGVTAQGAATWTSASADGSNLAITTTGFGAVLVTLRCNGIFTAGTILFQVNEGSSLWWSIFGDRTDAFTSESSHVLVGIDRIAWTFNLPASTQFRVLLTPSITGSSAPTANITVEAIAATTPYRNVGLAAGTNVFGSLVANQSVNVAQIAGAATSTNNGTTDAGTQRMTLSSDSTGQVKLAASSGTDIGKLTLHQSVNVDQLNGTATDTNSGTKSAGTLRVVLATDQPALTNKLLVTPDSVALPANQSVNVSQWNGVAPTAAAALSDAIANPTPIPAAAFGMRWDGTQWVRETANLPISLLASGAHTTAQASPLEPNKNCKGLRIYVNVTLIPGSAPSLTPQLFDRMPVGAAADGGVWSAAAPITTTGLKMYDFYPGDAMAIQGLVIERLQVCPVGTSWYFNMAVGNANSCTYAVEAVEFL